MKRLKLLVLLLPLLSGCDTPNTQLDPSKTWVISSKDRYLGNVYKLGICRFTLVDGKNYEYFDDSCNAYRLGDTINHPYRDKEFEKNEKFADSIRKWVDTAQLRGI